MMRLLTRALLWSLAALLVAGAAAGQKITGVTGPGGSLSNPVTPAQGGTGQNFSGSTGLLYVAAGTFSAIPCASGILQGGSPPACTASPNIGTATGTSFQGITGNVTPAAGWFTTLGVNIGVTTPATELHVASTVTTSPRGIMSAQYNTGTDGARLHMRKARGTLGTPLTVVTGDNLGRLVASGYDGTSYLEMASIVFGAEGTIGTNRIPTNIQFQTATDAAPSVLTTQLTINSAGSVLPGVDGQQIGSATLRWNYRGNVFLMFINGGDTQPYFRTDTDATLQLGAGGSTAPDVFFKRTATKTLTVDAAGGSTALALVNFITPKFQIGTVLFAALGTPVVGTFAYCSDCDAPAAGIMATCTSAGSKTGAWAFRVNATPAWGCMGI